MKRAFKIIGFVAVTCLLLFGVCAVAFYHLARVGEFRRFVIEAVEKNTDLKVELGDADLEIGWITGIVFRNVSLAEPDAPKPAITAERITARVALQPLLYRKVIFYEIRVQKPRAEFIGDKEGRIALLDKLLNLPFLKQPDSDFSLDLRSIKLQNGDIDYTDQRKEGSLGAWQLRNADVNLERVRGQRLRAFMKDLLTRQSTDSEGAALQFDLKSVVEKDDAKMNLRAEGRLVFPRETLEFHQARWNADVQLVDFPATFVKQRLAGRIPIKSMTGHFGQRIHVEGNPEQQLQLKGDIEFKQLSVDAPDLLLAPLTGADGRTTFEVDWSREKLQVKRADFRSSDLKFSLDGALSALTSKDPHIRLNLSALSAPLATLRKYLPLKIIDSPQWEKALNSLQTGQFEFKKAGVDASVEELRRLGQTGMSHQIWFDAELREISGSLPVNGTLPMRAIQGQVSLTDGLLTVRDVKGGYGDSRLIDVDGSYDLSPKRRGALDLKARGDFNLAELREQLKAEFFSARVAKIASSIQEIDGRSRVDLALRHSANEPIQFDGKVVLDNARLRYEDYSLSEIKGEIAFTPKEITGEKIRAQLSESPVQIQLALKEYGSDDGTFDLGVESTGVRSGVIARLLLNSGSLNDPGIVRGSVRYRGNFASKDTHKFTSDLELTNVQLRLKPLLQPLRELSGKIKIDDTGIDFQNLKGLLAGVPASASGRWRYNEKPQLLFDFAAPNLDVTYLIAQIDPESTDFYANLLAEGKITLAKGRIKNFEFGDLKTDVTIERRVWRLTNLSARSADGTIAGVTTIFDRPETLGVIAEPKIQGVPVQSFLKWFDLTNTEMTGRVNLTGKLETVGKTDPERKQNLNGAFSLRIEEGTINRMRIVVQLLNLLDLSRWFTLQMPDLGKQGIRFHAVTGDFKVTKGVYTTENLLVDSNDLRMTGGGKIDVPKNEIDFVVAVRPFAGIDTAMNQIPILGRGIAAIKNSFLVASFNIKGKIEDPVITPAPLGTLTEWFWGVLGIPKSILSVGEAAKKEEPKESAPPPAK